MHLKYFVSFRAQEGVDAQLALREKLLHIEGVAIDTSVNANKWQVPEEDLDFFVQTLQGAQLRADHAESVFMIVGRVPEAKRKEQEVYFKAEVGGEEKLIDKILRGYIKYVSVQVDSEDVECSKCHKQTRKEGLLTHLCPEAWEIVHKPTVRELSIVASPAYKNTEFHPVGFAAAMNEVQKHTTVETNSAPTCANLDEPQAQSSKGDNNVGSRREPQEPENKQNQTGEVKLMSDQNAQAKASPHQAQTAVNVAPGEQAPKELTYQQYMDQLTQLEKQILQKPGASDAELDALNKKIAELEAEVGKRAKKAELGKRIGELSKKLSSTASDDAEESTEDDGDKTKDGETTNKAKRVNGKGIVAVDEIKQDALSNYDWFKDLIKASRKLTSAGFKG